MQACHDSSKAEEGRKVPITCPQHPVQRQLVTELLNKGNRILHPISIRSQLDPQVFAERRPVCTVLKKKAQNVGTRRKESTATSVASVFKEEVNQTLRSRTNSVIASLPEVGELGFDEGISPFSQTTVMYEEENDILEFQTKHSRSKVSLSFRPGHLLQFEEQLGTSTGHSQLVKVVGSPPFPTRKNDAAKRVEPAQYPTLNLIRSPSYYIK